MDISGKTAKFGQIFGRMSPDKAHFSTSSRDANYLQLVYG